MNHFARVISHYSTVAGSVDLGIVPFFWVVHFFVYGGILSLPYQFYHHAHKMLCDHGQIFFFFVSDTDPHRVTLSECAYGSPVCPTVCHRSDCV